MKQKQIQQDSLTKDLTAMRETLKGQESTLIQAGEKIRNLRKELDVADEELGSQKRLANRLKNRVDRFCSSAAKVAEHNPLMEKAASSLSLTSSGEQVLLIEQLSDDLGLNKLEEDTENVLADTNKWHTPMM